MITQEQRDCLKQLGSAYIAAQEQFIKYLGTSDEDHYDELMDQAGEVYQAYRRSLNIEEDIANGKYPDLHLG